MDERRRQGVLVRWGIDLISAYVGGLIFGAPIGLVLYKLTQADALLTGAILIAAVAVLIWRLASRENFTKH